jgi:hypothetical protein
VKPDHPNGLSLASNRRLAALLNLVVLAAFAIAVEHWWGWSRLLAPWAQIAAGTLLLAVIGMLASYGLRALRIYLAERDIPRGQYFACLRLILINNVVNLLLPARSGEASFPILMRRWFGIDPARATGTLIWLRLLDLHVLATIAGLCAAAGYLVADSRFSALAGVAAVVAALAPLLLFVLRKPIERALAGRGSKAAVLASRVIAGLPAAARGLALDLVLTWAAWGIKLAALGIVMAKLAGLPVARGVLGAIGGDLSTVLPVHAPGGFGTYEIGVLALLAPGASLSEATGSQVLGPLIAAAVNLHLLVLTTALLAGAAAWLSGTMRPGAAGTPDAKL